VDIASVIALSKQNSLLNHSEVLANNISNAETTGFKESRMIEREFKVGYNLSKYHDYVNDISTFKTLQNGDLRRTENPLDISIIGEGFFMVSTKNGYKYTRAGNFTLNQNSELVTMEGYNVLNNSQTPIVFPQDVSEIIIEEDGTIKADGVILDTIIVATFDINALVQEGAQFFKDKNNALPNIADPGIFKVAQGYLEGSNVNKIKQLTTLIEVQRDTSNVTNLLNTYDDLTRSVISKINN